MKYVTLTKQNIQEETAIGLARIVADVGYAMKDKKDTDQWRDTRLCHLGFHLLLCWMLINGINKPLGKNIY